MTLERAPDTETPMTGADAATIPWDVARDRLANPEPQRPSWLATVRPDGRPHLMPVLAFWIDGGLHLVLGEGTRKARNLLANGSCVVGTASTTLPSLDVIVEGRAEPLTDEVTVERVAEHLRTNGWPLDVRGTEVHGPHAPTAGPPPYRIFRVQPSRVFGLPGMHGMEQYRPDELPKPTRWEFA